ncbi:hypothetical protein GJ744_006497 [Endocarpon pusillum]|uniref:Uncharacterized protein n=1 Tax=Endocarpon pusillum TaxID=364733 RepID=A0A8H7EA42_9EURO|nr:hypothetical protein GJ744_006497 [Endocarpon pusillum]
MNSISKSPLYLHIRRSTRSTCSVIKAANAIVDGTPTSIALLHTADARKIADPSQRSALVYVDNRPTRSQSFQINSWLP